MTKPGPIIGLIIGILMAGFPIVGMMIGEASLSDPKGRMMGFGFIIFGAFMVIVNIIALVKGTDNLLADEPSAKTVSHSPIAKQETDAGTGEIRCRFCGKRYSADYNGCLHCKKK